MSDQYLLLELLLSDQKLIQRCFCCSCFEVYLRV